MEVEEEVEVKEVEEDEGLEVEEVKDLLQLRKEASYPVDPGNSRASVSLVWDLGIYLFRNFLFGDFFPFRFLWFGFLYLFV